MSTVTIDDVEYDTDSMSEEALANLKSLQFVDAELARLNAKISVMSTARNAYATALQQLLPDQSKSDDLDEN